ncbi:MAG TPA: FecR family protein, partial [Dissulfurispiraceae bacterium]|nr:FecR family protein [Dissulfurispiraceae bacterium]
MKHVSAMLIAAVLLLTPVYAFSDNLGYARMSLMEGDVQVYTTDAGDWGPASINGPLAEGDQVWVPEGGKVELQLNSGTYIRLDQGSALQILSMNNETSQFYVSQGHAYVYYDPAGGNALQVDTRDASTRAFGQAIFRIDITDQVTEVSVYKGYVETENSAGNLRVNG